MPASPLRYKRLIREIPKHKSAKDALIASGFSESTANSNARRAVSSAIKHQAREILETHGNLPTKTKILMSELVGLSREEMFDTIKKIALQDKDYGSALKVLAPLSKEHGVILSAEDDKTNVIVPVINLGFGTDNMAKNIEPVIEHIKVEGQELDNGLTKP